MKKIIVINGIGGAGKDTVCEMIKENFDTTVISSVDEVKTIAKFIGWEGSKQSKDRLFLSNLKDLLTWYNDRPLQYILQNIETFRNNDSSKIMLIHIREPHEIDKLKKIVPDLITLFIENNNIKENKGNHADDNCSEYKYDYIIDNSHDLETLRQSVKTFTNELFGHEEEI